MEQPIPIKKPVSNKQPRLLSSTRKILKKQTNKLTKSTLRTHKYALRAISSSGYMTTILVMTPTRLFTSLDICFFQLLFFGVVALSVNRFLAIHLHLRYQELMTLKRVVAVVISIWVMSVFDSLSMSFHAIFTHLL